MTDEINKDFVGIHLDSGGTWSSIIPGKIERISGQIDRVECIAHQLFGACEGFICPTEIEYSIRIYSEDGPIESIDPMDDTANIELLSTERKTITDEDGLSAEDIPFGAYAHQDDICFIGDIEIIQASVSLKLHEYDGWIDRTDDQYVKPARLSTVYDGQAKHDPVAIRLYHIPASHADTSIDFVISIISPTNVWFEETPVGRANRRRLKAFFERLFGRFDIIDTTVTAKGKNERMIELLPE